jgi:hypothetical protein
MGQMSSDTGAISGPGSKKADKLQLMPGVVVLGIGTPKEMLQVAANDGADVMLLFDVSITLNPRNGQITNASELQLYDVKKGTKLQSFKTPNNIQVQITRAAAKPDEDDIVEKALDNVFTYADEHLKVQEMLSLKPEQALNRAVTLTTSVDDNPLPTLTEIRYYHRKQLLTDEQFQQASQKLLGEDKAAKLVAAEADERKEAVAQWLPENRTKRQEVGGDKPFR